MKIMSNRSLQRLTPAAGRSLPAAAAVLTSRATVACSAEPGTTSTVNAASSAPSDP